MPAPFRHRHGHHLARYIRTGKTFVGGPVHQTFGRRKDGTLFPTGLSIAELRMGNQRMFVGLVRDLTERKRLEKEILEISEREQRRIGQDLHDGLGQHLAAVELKSRVLERRLEQTSKKEAAQAAEIAAQVREAMVQTRLLSRGLSPVVLESRGLVAALQELASSTEQLFRIKCGFRCPTPVPVKDQAVATHLYRIAQEAVSNALKHGRAGRIDIELGSGSDKLVLAVKDNGIGISKDAEGRGMGLQTMRYRAVTMGATLLIREQSRGGTLVQCTLQHPAYTLPRDAKP
jgi:two-component system CheB/CheR fusion protein